MKHTLLLAAFILAGISTASADPRNPSSFALSNARSQQAPAVSVASQDVKYVATSNTKGGTVITQVRDTDVTSIALSKSTKGDSCSSCKVSR